jgi:hypothetical protein
VISSLEKKGNENLKREAGYIVLALIFAVAMTAGYYELTLYTSPSVAPQVLRGTNAKTEAGIMSSATFSPMLIVVVFVVGLACACLAYSFTKKRSG